MASIFESNERKVIPNFRTFIKTLKLGEIDSFNLKNPQFIKNNIEAYIEDFKTNREISFAGDLISAALINGELENRNVIEAAKFVIDNNQKSTISQINLARKILGESAGLDNSKIDKIEEFLEHHTKEVIHDRIRKLKEQSNSVVPNPFTYVELARLYSIIAQKTNAYKNILIAFNLAPNNRYVLRSFARLIAHLGDIEYAHKVLKRAAVTKNDPWLLASEIAFASLRGINSSNIKLGHQILESRNFSPFSTSELSAALGTVEMIHGTRKKSKHLFEQALVKPNDNSLAQVEWANNKDHLFDFSLLEFNVSNDYEAKALDAFHHNKWNEALQYADSWFIDMPFARRPAEFGNHVSAIYLEDHASAVKFCKAGLVSNPNDSLLLNNIAYSYALLDMPDEGLRYLSKVDLDTIKDVKHKICIKATKGLLMYRKGQFAEGRQLYLEAIEEARNNNLEQYNWLAIINMANEEFRINSNESKELLTILNKIPDRNEEVTLLKTRVIERNKHRF